MNNPSFKEVIDTRVKAAADNEPAPTDVIRIEYEKSSLEVRKRGAFITECSLETFRNNPALVDILYCDPDTSKAKLPASHIMTPVGPSEDIGGQHGVGRWVDWHVFETSDDGPIHRPIVVMQAKRDDFGESLSRTLKLGKHELVIYSSLRSNSDKDRKVSIGEHLYFPCKEKDIPDIKIYNEETYDLESLETVFGKYLVNDLIKGKPFFWSGFNGMTDIDFGNDKFIHISCDLEIGDEMAANQMIGMLIWHRPGTDSICFEPVVGFYEMPDGTTRNNELRLAPRDKIELSTTIRAE